MERQQMQSSNIVAIGYDPDTSELEVEFKSGTVYRYGNVPADEHQYLIMSESLGRHFQQHIKPNYECRRVVILPVLVAGEPTHGETP